MIHLLDTNAMSRLMRGDPQHVAHLVSMGPGAVAIPQPVAAEIAYGLERLPPSRSRRTLERAFAALLAQMARAEWTDEVSRRFGTVKAELERRGMPLEDFDVAVAAHALALDAVLVTENARHFERIPELRFESWSR